MWRGTAFLLGMAWMFILPACTKHKVEVAPVEVKPIHITIDINVKVDKALEDFFKDIDQAEIKLGKTGETTDEAPAKTE
jgi:hypothetical protein